MVSGRALCRAGPRKAANFRYRLEGCCATAWGQRRADAVRRYLSRQDSIPLSRMSSISYGDTLPVAPNKTRKGRAENRRVVLVVLE